MSRHYVLDANKQPQPAELMEWARWFETAGAERVVAKTEIGDAMVSTVFLGLDHQWALNGPPLIYETMVFGGALGGEQERYSTPEEAQSGHAAMVERASRIPLSEGPKK